MVKKLATALRKGEAISTENGIKNTKGRLINVNLKSGKICGACALGKIYIGNVGLKKAQARVDEILEVDTSEEYVFEGIYEDLKTMFPQLEENRAECLGKQFSKRLADNHIGTEGSVLEVIFTVNDKSRQPMEKIADALEACKL